MRQIVLDTETTGLEVAQGNRILEVGCVELIDRKLTNRHYHEYINPQRASEEGALGVHGLTTEFLSSKPLFKSIWPSFIEFVRGAELIIHNSAFDLAFLNEEMRRIDPGLGKLEDYCGVIDSLAVAKQKHPGQKNNLDALCRRYSVDNSQRELHGALLDSEILADVYLLMTGGQVALSLGGDAEDGTNAVTEIRRLSADRPKLKVVLASVDEMSGHEAKLDKIDKASDGAVWRGNPS